MRTFIRNVFTLVIAFLLLSLELYLAPTYADAPFEPNIRVNELVPVPSSSTQDDPSVTVDNAGNIYVAWTDERYGDPDIYFAKSTDGGNTFSANKRVNDDVGNAWQYAPSIAVDGGGNIYITWNDYRDGPEGDIYFVNSTDGGSTFSANNKVNDDVVTAGQNYPFISVDGAGNIYITWTDNRNGDPDIYFANSTDGGNTFSANKKVNDDALIAVQYEPSITVDGAGNIYVTWTDNRNGDPDIYFAKSTDVGNTFSANKKVNDDIVNAGQNYPSISADGAGNIYVTWTDNRNGNSDIYFAKSTDGGNTFSTNKKVNDDGGNAGQYEPSIAVDGAGNIYVTWTDNRNGDPDIYFVKSTDGGNTFSTNKKVNDDAANAGQYEPSIAADGAGKIYIAWRDDRNGDSDIYFAYSADGGNTFSANKRVDDDDIMDARQYEPTMAVDSAGNIYIAWKDDRNGDPDIYFTKSTDGGNTFSADKKVNDDIGNAWQYKPSIAVDGAGNIYITWWDDRNGFYGDIYFTKSTDGGNSFSVNKKVNDDVVSASQNEPSVAVDGAGNIYIAWRDNRSGNYDIYFANSTDGGNSFSVNKKVNDDVVNASQNEPSVAVDGAGNIYITWRDNRDGNYDIYFAKSTDGGNSFSVNKKVNDDVVGAGQRDPSIAADGAGNIYITWRDDRNGNPDIYFANSDNGGNTFSANKKVNDDAGNAWQYEPSIVVDSAGNIYIAWADKRNGDFDIYLTNSVDFGNRFSEGKRVNDDIGDAGQFHPSMAVDGAGNIYIAWEDNRNGSSDIYFTTTESIQAIIITEIQDSPDGSEWVEVYNPGLATLNLFNYKISLDLGTTFIDGSWSDPVIDPGEYSVWTPGITGILNDEGAMLSIHNFTDPTRPMLDVVGYGQNGTVPDPLTGESSARYWDSGLLKYRPSWSRNGTTGPTPGAVNNAPGVNSRPLVILNEVCFYPLLPEYGFIELMYIRDSSMDISNYKIVCDSEYIIPGGTILNKDYPYFGINQPNYPPDFNLDDGVTNGDNVYLYDDNGNLLDMVGWSSYHTINLTVSRVPNGFGTYQGFNDTTSEEAGWSFDRIPSLSLIYILPDSVQYGEKGESITYNLTIINKQINDDTMDITNVTAPWGLEVVILDENGTPLIDSNGNGIPDIFVNAGGQVNITVVVIASTEIPLVDFETTIIKVQSTFNPLFTDIATLITKVYPYLLPDKKVRPTQINIFGTGHGEEATITITASGHGCSLESVITSYADIVFVVDDTSSMSGVINDIKDKILNITEVFEREITSVRFGLVTYKDIPEVHWDHTLTFDVNAFIASVKALKASGGDDWQEDVTAALNLAINASWRPGNVSKIIILIGDAPDHDPWSPCPVVNAALVDEWGIFTSAIACSGAVEEIFMAIADNGSGVYAYYSGVDPEILVQAIIDAVLTVVPPMNISAKDNDISDSNPMMRDVLPDYIHYVPGSFSIQPDTIYVDDRGYTFIEWNVSEILIDESWAVTFNITSTMLGPQLTNEVQTSRVNYTNWNNESITILFPETNIYVTIGEPSPPKLFIDVLPDGRGDDIKLSWIPPPELNVTHYLIYKSEDQTNFDFTDVWIDTSKDQDPLDGLIIPLRTTFNHTGAAKLGHGNYSQEWFYIIRAVNSLGEVSDTSRTVGKWTKIFQPGTSTFSMPLEPLLSIDTYNITIDMGANYIKWMDPITREWSQHNLADPVELNNTNMLVGKGFEVDFTTQVKYTFTGMPGGMILYDNISFGFDATPLTGDADSLTAKVDNNGNITLNWTLPTNIGSGDQYYVLRSTSRDGFWGTLGVNYTQLAVLPFNVLLYQDIGNATPGTEFYYMIVPVNLSTSERGVSSYSIGVWTAGYLDQYDTFALPLKLNSYKTADWYCDNIPDTVGINYYIYSEQRWGWHSTRMPASAFDLILEMTFGYQISTSSATKFTFIGV